MKKQYIHFPNGQKFRVESNWNAFETFCELTGRTNLTALDEIGDIRINEAPVLLWACIREGEDEDGNKFHLTLDQLKKKIVPGIMGEFFKIYVEQTYAQLPEDYRPKKKNLKTTLFGETKKKSPSE